MRQAQVGLDRFRKYIYVWFYSQSRHKSETKPHVRNTSIQNISSHSSIAYGVNTIEVGKTELQLC
jgi:hypothetical protein